jgi:hypothetical protein
VRVALRLVMATHERVVLVTGGTGLVGKGIEAYITKHPRPKEKWVYAGSKDGDLRYAILQAFLKLIYSSSILRIFPQISVFSNNWTTI